MQESAWWKDFYDDSFTLVTEDWHDEDKLDAETDFIIETFGLKPGDRLFDQCCGSARMSSVLARKGLRITGIDQSADYIAAAHKADAKGDYHVGDAFTFVAPAPCDAAINWWTSFGFFDDDAANIRMVQRLFDSLKPGGRCGIEYSNAAYEITHFRDSVSYSKPLPEGGGVTFVREYRLDLDRAMRCSRWIYSYTDGRRVERTGETRMYKPEDIEEMLRRCGFEDAASMADITGAAVTADSPRFICLARKPV